MVTDIARKGLEYLKENQSRIIEYDEFHNYLEREFNLTPHQVDLYLQEMQVEKWAHFLTSDKPKRVLLSDKGDELLKRLSKWDFFSSPVPRTLRLLRRG